MSISDKLKEIQRLALEIKEDAENNAAAAKTNYVRRYYRDVLLQESWLDRILNSSFASRVIPRAEQFERSLDEGE